MSQITALASRFAATHNLDISLIKGSGFRDKILLEDVEKYLKNPQPQNHAIAKSDDPLRPDVKRVPPAELRLDASLDVERQKLSGIRKAIMKSLRTSQRNVVYFNLVHEANVTKLWEHRNSIKDNILKIANVKVTFLAYVVKAVTLALKEFQIVGAKYDPKTLELVYPASANIGIAVDTPNGLFVPVIQNAQNLSLVEIASEIIRLASLAREGKLKLSDMQGATFTITNYGSVGSYFGTPVINFPEVGILGLGTITNKVMVENKQLVNAKSLYLATAADHRFIDGSTIGRFTSQVKAYLENPQLLGVF